MPLELLENRRRAIGIGGTIAGHLIVIALLLWLAPGPSLPVEPPHSALISIHVTEPPPPPPPPPVDERQGAAAPPSRGKTAAPAPPPIPHPLATPTPAQVAPDSAPQQASGLGTVPGAGAGTGGEGSGSGSGTGGAGRGSGRVNPPVHLSGELTNRDYRNAGAPRGAAGTVVVSFRIRSDGAADRCVVIASSGFSGFDQATCRFIEQRFRFRPALDESGRPIDWTVRTDYTWAPR